MKQPKKLKGKKRALNSKDSYRLNSDIPLITDKTELITIEMAEEMLQKNKSNRPINWNKVEEYRKAMERGEWKFHSQGIILDEKGNLLTGQKRLWAIIYSQKPQYFRVSKGTPSDLAHLIDRGTPQSSRDLASRKTERKHSPTEASIIRAMLAVGGKIKPSLDDIATGLVNEDEILKIAMEKTKGVKKTKPIMMIMGAICHIAKKNKNKEALFALVSELSDDLIQTLEPIEVEKCWNRGAAFTLAMEKAIDICNVSYKELFK